jgi:hypothetical protein
MAVGRPSAVDDEHAIDFAARVLPQDGAGFVEADALPEFLQAIQEGRQKCLLFWEERPIESVIAGDLARLRGSLCHRETHPTYLHQHGDMLELSPVSRWVRA